MESIYQNSPELDPARETQKQTVEPIQTSKPISQTHQVKKLLAQPNNAPVEKPQEPQPEPELITRQQQEQVMKTAARFLHLIGKSVWNNEESFYHIMSNQENLLVIHAKDGRGEILRYQDGNIVTQKLTSEDVDKFKKIDSILDERVAEIQARQQLESNRQIELEP